MNDETPNAPEGANPETAPAPKPEAPAPPKPAAPAAPAAAPKPAAPARPTAPPPPPPPSLTPEQEATVAQFRARFGDAIEDTGLAAGALRLTVKAGAIREAAAYCLEQGYNYPDTVTAVDLPAEGKFRVVYVLANVPDTRRTLVLHVDLPHDDDASVPTVADIYPGADWDEREVYDLFGISFEGHPDLRRIMTPDDWEGHPLRKDYSFID